jgi:hypothetical protein
MNDAEKKAAPVRLLPFNVVVTRLVEYYIPVAAATAADAKDIAEQMVMDGHADDFAHECDIQEDGVDVNAATLEQIRDYKFTDTDGEDHTF